MSDARSYKSKFFPIGKTPSRPVLLIVAGWFMGGFALVFGSVFPLDVNPALDVSSAEWFLGIMLMVGSVLVSLSALPWHKESTSWRLELSGWPVLGFAWLLYIALILLTNWTAIFPLAVGLSFVAASVQRWLEVNRHIFRTRRNLSALEEQRAEGSENA